MSDDPKLLVVDDEAVICQACQRVFSRQGYEVEPSTDARQGLTWALERNYDGILLDIKMPQMDGIQFLEQLRKTKPDVPVMIMTGYPSIPNAAAAVRLGASDYVTKPFTPEEITQSVRRMLRRELAAKGQIDESLTAVETAELEVEQAADRLFLDEAWVLPEADGSASIGAVLPRPVSAVREVRLPKVGDVVYQGLPLASVTFRYESTRIVPSPISGVVVGINEELRQNPALLTDEPCRAGWLACVCTTRLEEELPDCKPRRVVLANSSGETAEKQGDLLRWLGCAVESAATPGAVLGAIAGSEDVVVVFDADSFGGDGPDLVRRINGASPAAKVVVVASSDCGWEAAYRAEKIFYYAVEPFADGEISEILYAAFRRPVRPVELSRAIKNPDEPVSGVRITNRNGHKVHLLAAPGLLKRGRGLGERILRKLNERAFPVMFSPGQTAISDENVLKTAANCDRAMVLLAEDSGRLPGSLARDTKAEYVTATRENAARVTTLVVQPAEAAAGLDGLDERTVAALAEHIVQEMASY